ncbi:aminoglycoside phosphotransferase family protein [Dongia soli]|uniref:Aminoglycoside phosphotransferase family protein n=1 Tax=Dongia soli TaxID=600628 RepID=A0ABU5EG51_9PROT|nr:aminoglycoside phosphotransferase family protein [Dongia soli]MDY0884829.1 aminoglycoside phosphotransferase family protein [Dongia soli]
MFDDYLRRWHLARDGSPIHTHSSDLLPVRRDHMPAMLKIARESEEQRGPIALEWWDGLGAARVFERDAHAVLMERAIGSRSLPAIAYGGGDDEATRILCATAALLHAPRTKPPPLELVSLETWFVALWPLAAHGRTPYQSLLRQSAAAARLLLDTPQEEIVLHGDLHHGNVLDFGTARGWLAIDPKGLYGERGFDFANILCNPEPEDDKEPVALRPGRFARQIDIILDLTGLDRARLLRWVQAYGGLSAAWYLNDGDDEEAQWPLAIARLAADELAGG